MGYRTLLRQEYVTGHNNSNLTPFATLVADGEWELLLRISSHYCFITVFINNWIVFLPCDCQPMNITYNKSRICLFFCDLILVYLIHITILWHTQD